MAHATDLTIEQQIQELDRLNELKQEVHRKLLDRIKQDLEKLTSMGYAYSLSEPSPRAVQQPPETPHASAMKTRWARFRALGGTGRMTTTKLASLERKAKNKTA